jgi:hypothetical protein
MPYITGPVDYWRTCCTYIDARYGNAGLSLVREMADYLELAQGDEDIPLQGWFESEGAYLILAAAAACDVTLTREDD